jgi:23S rRNA (cytidine1920-2'-O)/16S rRNA (cytidine1409-2'-O)-methyltransferase
MTARLDAALAARGLARSRTHAATLIAEGLVTVDGRGVVKPSAPVSDDAVLVVAGADHYVSRAAHKLLAALDAFEVDVAGRPALDLGASTGGFTQVLRERGAAPVIALDVGHGQIAPAVAADPEVIVIEGFNARELSVMGLREASGVDTAPEVVTGDLSFISLHHVLAPIRDVLAVGGDIVLLVKPQFEVGRTAVKGGLVTDAALRADAVTGVLWAAWDAGLGTLGVVSSPIVGTHGNAEFLVHFGSGRGSNPTEWLTTVDALAYGR